jgi:hypothetical protein
MKSDDFEKLIRGALIVSIVYLLTASCMAVY